MTTESEQPAHKATARPQVLVVDADRLFARVLKAKLGSWGYPATIVHRDGEALAAFKAEPFRIVLLDLDLAGAAGMELCRRFRALPRPRYTYLICFGSRSETELGPQALDAGADDFLAKPLNLPELRARLDRAEKVLAMDDALFSSGNDDPAAGVVGPNAFRRFFAVALAQARRAEGCGVLMFVHIANLDEISRRHGFQVAHQVTVEIARRLRDIHRSSDLVGRLADDQFCLLLHHTRSDMCEPVARRAAAIAGEVRVPVGHAWVTPQLSVELLDFPAGDMLPEAYLSKLARLPYANPFASPPTTNTDHEPIL